MNIRFNGPFSRLSAKKIQGFRKQKSFLQNEKEKRRERHPNAPKRKESDK